MGAGLAVVGLMGAAAQAAGPVGPAGGVETLRDNQVSFTSSASIEVPKDVLSVTLQASREGPDAAAVQAALKQMLDGALAEARRAAQPGLLEVRTGSFSLSPRYGRDGKPNGWTGTADLTLEGRDVGRVAATAGRLNALAIVATGYSVSRELREQHEAALIAQAIQKYQVRAGEIAKQFGFTSYTLRELSVQTGDGDAPRPPVLMRSMGIVAADAAAPLPTEAGKGLLTATVQGSVQLTR
ncbi:MAG TPA: SIMPL domain-containing protein [Burkholderiaceae bacterium]|nr:SIMPL domain-containing protein [Burkholderiaceae bacterium]